MLNNVISVFNKERACRKSLIRSLPPYSDERMTVSSDHGDRGYDIGIGGDTHGDR